MAGAGFEPAEAYADRFAVRIEPFRGVPAQPEKHVDLRELYPR